MRATYNGSQGSINAGYGYDRDSQRVDYGASGSIIAPRRRHYVRPGHYRRRRAG